MRKDVKLGMAIGGGLIAAMVGYLLFAPPANNNKKGTQLAGGPTSIIDPGDAGAGDANPANAGQPAAGDGASTNGNGAPADPSGNGGAARPTPTPKDAAAPKPEDKSKPGTPADNNGGGGASKSVIAGKSGTAATPKHEAGTPKHEAAPKHETVADGSGVTANGSPATIEPRAKLYYNPNDAWGGGVSTEAVFAGPSARKASAKIAASAAGDSGPAPADATAVADGTHIVRAGETLSSIALQAYGSSSLYHHILRANPGVNPNNLKLGTALKLPKLEDLKTAGSPSAAGGPGELSDGGRPIKEEPKIDPSRQYRVTSGDSLYKIAMRLYGKSAYVDKLYERNKATIGPNPTRLKLGMILDLPEPAASASAAPVEQTLSGGPQ
jgi:nucleoid-associated protein YgaU